MTLAEQHAGDPKSACHWVDRAARLKHPIDRPAVFYEHFDDGSFVQVTVPADGEPVIAPGVSYIDAQAQKESVDG